MRRLLAILFWGLRCAAEECSDRNLECSEWAAEGQCRDMTDHEDLTPDQQPRALLLGVHLNFGVLCQKLCQLGGIERERHADGRRLAHAHQIDECR